MTDQVRIEKNSEMSPELIIKKITGKPPNTKDWISRKPFQFNIDKEIWYGCLNYADDSNFAFCFRQEEVKGIVAECTIAVFLQEYTICENYYSISSKLCYKHRTTRNTLVDINRDLKYAKHPIWNKFREACDIALKKAV